MVLVVVQAVGVVVRIPHRALVEPEHLDKEILEGQTTLRLLMAAEVVAELAPLDKMAVVARLVMVELV